MTPPLTLQPNCPMETPAAAKTTSTQLFGVLYITLTGNGRHYGAQLKALVFAWAIHILYYQVSTHPMVGITLCAQLYSIPRQPMPLPMPGFLTHILWWALPSRPAGCPPASSQEPPTGWILNTGIIVSITPEIVM
ncbi:hypothetical protein DSO57_1015232 [Entomophthora muscae]|uniref:Uncharacterized protein n=1 Tax=Entomophthora muscae TaxID=34485 RepID=A0ACC2TSZ8_9FUNG|nr:hypothetical protein DSO57_1015232 [Entomophthora muscae]